MAFINDSHGVRGAKKNMLLGYWDCGKTKEEVSPGLAKEGRLGPHRIPMIK